MNWKSAKGPYHIWLLMLWWSMTTTMIAIQLCVMSTAPDRISRRISHRSEVDQSYPSHPLHSRAEMSLLRFPPTKEPGKI